MKPSLLINQPGRHGDIIVGLPISMWYSRDFCVDWFCPEEYHLNFRNIPYCKPVSVQNRKYDAVIDLSFGLRQDSDLHKWWVNTRDGWASFIVAKYYLAKVPLKERWNLIWERDIYREKALLEIVTKQYGTDFTVCHEKTHDGTYVSMDVPNKVPFSPIRDFNIFDWYLVLQEAGEIHCIDSVLCNFVEVLPEFVIKKKVYYKAPRNQWSWNNTILTNNWIEK